MLLGRQTLIPEHDHEMLEQSRSDRGNGSLLERRGEIHTGNLGAEGTCEGSDFHGRRFVNIQAGRHFCPIVADGAKQRNMAAYAPGNRCSMAFEFGR
jgi:hypothetical protein